MPFAPLTAGIGWHTVELSALVRTRTAYPNPIPATGSAHDMCGVAEAKNAGHILYLHQGIFQVLTLVTSRDAEARTGGDQGRGREADHHHR